MNRYGSLSVNVEIYQDIDFKNQEDYWKTYVKKREIDKEIIPNWDEAFHDALLPRSIFCTRGAKCIEGGIATTAVMDTCGGAMIAPSCIWGNVSSICLGSTLLFSEVIGIFCCAMSTVPCFVGICVGGIVLHTDRSGPSTNENKGLSERLSAQENETSLLNNIVLRLRILFPKYLANQDNYRRTSNLTAEELKINQDFMRSMTLFGHYLEGKKQQLRNAGLKVNSNEAFVRQCRQVHYYCYSLVSENYMTYEEFTRTSQTLESDFQLLKPFEDNGLFYYLYNCVPKWNEGETLLWESIKNTKLHNVCFSNSHDALLQIHKLLMQ